VVTLAAQDLGFKERKVDPGLCSNPYLFLEGNNQGGATFNFQQTTA
jgi:tubulin polyglutamylase TTLL6/13